MASQPAVTRTGLRRRLPVLIGRVRKDRALYVMLALPVLFFLIFHYQPMYGVLMAFKEFKISKGILGSPWADNFGFYHFIRFFSSNASFRLINNTFQLSFWSLVWGFPAPIILALLLHECRLPRFKRTVQTVTYLPHFISIVAIVGILTLLLSPRDGSINHMLAVLGLERIYFMADTNWFRPGLRHLRHLAGRGLRGDHLSRCPQPRKSRDLRGGHRGRRQPPAAHPARVGAQPDGGRDHPADPPDREHPVGRLREGVPDAERPQHPRLRRDPDLRVPGRVCAVGSSPSGPRWGCSSRWWG